MPELLGAEAVVNVPPRGPLPAGVERCIELWGHDHPHQPGVGHATVVYCTKGRGTCDLNGTRLVMGPGDLLIVPAGVQQAYAASATDAWGTFWLHVQQAVTAEYLRGLGVGDAPLHLPIGQEAKLVELVTEMISALEESDEPSNLVHASNVFRHLMGGLVGRQRESQWMVPNAAQRVATSIEFMKSNLAQSIDVPHLSQMARLSPSHYSVLFKRQTGYSPLDFLVRLRVKVACKLLESTNQGIKTIAAGLGYKDPLYFSRVFAGVQGISPSEYRNCRQQSIGGSDRTG